MQLTVANTGIIYNCACNHPPHTCNRSKHTGIKCNYPIKLANLLNAYDLEVRSSLLGLTDLQRHSTVTDQYTLIVFQSKNSKTVYMKYI